MINERNNIILSSAFFPPVSYFAAIAQADVVIIEKHETYLKQSYRNRCEIQTANGKLPLTVPVHKFKGNHTPTSEVGISYENNWNTIHWRTIESAYNPSPFFLYYKDDIEPFFQKQYPLLFELNYELLITLMSIIGLKNEISFSSSYEKESSLIDLRMSFSPKNKFSNSHFPEYPQVFSDKHGFIPDLSILDLLFNLGPDSKEYLNKISLF